MRLSAEHNLTPEELAKALYALAEAEGISEELAKAINRPRSCDDTPKEPRHPATRYLYRLMQQEFATALRDIKRYALEIQEGIRKSQMVFDFTQSHHTAYDRTDPRTGMLEHIQARGPQHHHVEPLPSVEQEDATMNLKQQLEAYKPQLAERFTKSVTETFNRFIEKFGPMMRGTANSGEFKLWEKIKPMTVRTPEGYHLNPGAIEDQAKAYADATVEAWHEKITGKVQDLEGATVHHLDGNRFLITGTRDGKRIKIEQDMIINFSGKGTAYNQFPARIYVDGKFTSEAAYKKLTGADQKDQQAAAAKRQANMLPNGVFAKGDNVTVQMRRRADGSTSTVSGKVTGEFSIGGETKIRVRTTTGMFKGNIDVKLRNLLQWNPEIANRSNHDKRD